MADALCLKEGQRADSAVVNWVANHPRFGENENKHFKMENDSNLSEV